MKSSIFLPAGGPSRFLRFFSSLLSRMSFTLTGLVCAEYTIENET